MLVPVTVVFGVTVAVVDVVNVIAMLDRFVSTLGTMRMRVVLVFGVRATFAFVPVSVVLDVRMAVVEEINVIAMRHRGMPATRSVGVVVSFVHRVRFLHQQAPLHGIRLRLPAM